MGARQSKRSVDITAPGKEALSDDQQQPLEGKLEMIEEGEKPATNGHTEPADIKDEVMSNGGGEAGKLMEAVAAAEPETPASPDTDVESPIAASENEIAEPEVNNKSAKKKDKVKKKWSFRSISFSKKDKNRPSKDDTKEEAETVPEVIEEKAEGGAGGLFASVTGAVTGAVDAVTKKAEEEVASIEPKVEEIITNVTEKAEEIVAAVTEKVGEIASSVTGKVTEVKEAADTEVAQVKSDIETAKTNMSETIDTEIAAAKSGITAATNELASAATEAVDLAKTEVAAVTAEVVTKAEELVKKVDEIPPPLPASPPPSEAVAELISQVAEKAEVETSKLVESVEKMTLEMPAINIQPASPVPASASELEEKVTKEVEAVMTNGEKVVNNVFEAVEATLENGIANGVDEATAEITDITTQCKAIVGDKLPIIEATETNPAPQEIITTAVTTDQNSVTE